MTAIDVDKLVVRDLLNSFRVYQLPFFQRPYVWMESRWETLFDDLKYTYSKKDYSHFLGSILTVAGKTKASGISFYYVVDGQQRLVTLTLILCAIRDLAQSYMGKFKSSNLEEIVSTANLILTNNYPKNYTERCKVFPTRIDCPDYFRIVVPGGNLS